MMSDKMTLRTRWQSSRRLRWGTWAVGATALFAVLGFLVLPPIVRHVAVDKLSEALHRPVNIDRVAINPFTLTLEVENLNIGEREGETSFAGFERLRVNLQASSLFRGGPVIDEIRLVGPWFHLARLDAERYNFSDLLDIFGAPPEKAADAATPAFSLNNIFISDGTVEFDDRVIGGEKHRAENITLALPFVSNMDYATEIFIEPHFSAVVDGARLEAEAHSKPFSESRESEFLLRLNDVRLPAYFAYLPLDLPMALESGALDTDLKLAFSQESGELPRLTLSGMASVRDLKITGSAGRDLAAFRRLDVAIASADPIGGRLVIDRVTLDSPEITARVGPKGRLDWLDLLPSATDADGPEEAVLKEWSLGEAQISGGTLRWHDASNSPAFTAKIGAIDARVKNLDGQGSVADFEAAWTVDGGERLKVDAFTIGEGKLDLAKRWVRLGEVRVDGARAAISRLADGRIEWIALPESEIERRTSASARTNVRPGKEKASSAGSWTVEIARSVGRKIALRFEDAATSPPSTQQIENLNVELSGVSSEPGRTAGVKMAFRLNRTGEVAVDGTLGVQPLDANLKVKARTVELPPLQAYLAEKLDVGVARGHTTFDGTLRLRQPAEKGGKNAREKADDTLTGGFAGSLTIGDFQATEKASAARGTAPPDLLRWKSLRLSRLDVRFGPESVAIGDITLADFFARIVVSPQGKLNLLELARADETAEANAGAVRAASSGGTATAPVAARDGPVLPVTIGKVALRGGSVRFTDNFVKPNYTANLQGIAGSVTGLSSRTGTQAALTLTGRYDRVAPLDVSARINPLSAEPYLDLRAEVKGIELTSLSTYAEKYAGYAIEKGKLSLFVKYRIENGQLEAENRVFLDQLTFGDAVDSPDATALPVRLAVALLKNRDGEIDVNLPVSGSLDDPQFSVGGLIVRVVVNLLAKAATSPFALIGAMFGDDEALSEVEFDAGRAALASEAAGRLENLAKALIDRPALKFEIEGWADPAQDGDGLKRVFLERRLRGLKYGDRSGQNTGSSAPAGPVEITKEEYPGLLERVYRAERFPKPRNEIGIERSLPVEEMERLILVNTPVGENDLKALGDRRARAVRDWLVARNVAGDRIFLLPSRIGAGEAGESGRRARFSLGER